MKVGYVLFVCAVLSGPTSSMPHKGERGTVMALDFSPNLITIAADSRRTTTAGTHSDDGCKISAFGDRFLVVITGISAGPNWDSHKVARAIWRTESTKAKNAAELTEAVGKKWAKAAEVALSGLQLSETLTT